MKHTFIDLAGQRFGRWLVVGFHGIVNGDTMFDCVCDCGRVSVVVSYSLRRGGSKSCGCLSVEATRKRNRTHGLSKTKLHHVWHGMWQRCRNPNNPAYANYGGRGIKVCDRWLAFESFLADMGAAYKPGLTIDRTDNDGNYEPGNCRWATRLQQRHNRRDSHRRAA